MLAHQPRHLTATERATIARLATYLPTLWAAATTTPVDRKTVLRLLVDRVVATVAADSEWVDLAVHWAGGHETRTRLRRPVGKLIAMSNHQALLAEIRRLRADGYTAGGIAEALNAAGWTTPTQRNGFTERLVRVMLLRYGSVPKGPKRPPSDTPTEWWMADLAKTLQMPLMTLYGWLHRGWLQTRQVNGHWAVIADAAERRRLHRLRRQHPDFKRATRQPAQNRT